MARGAPQRRVRAAYLAAVKTVHPDVNPSPTAAAQFAALKDAYDALRRRGASGPQAAPAPAPTPEEALRLRTRASRLRWRVAQLAAEAAEEEREYLAAAESAERVATWAARAAVALGPLLLVAAFVGARRWSGPRKSVQEGATST